MASCRDPAGSLPRTSRDRSAASCRDSVGSLEVTSRDRAAPSPEVAAPSADAGIPLAPLRHLPEKSSLRRLAV